MAKPATLPRWAYTVLAVVGIVLPAPSSTKQQEGFANGEEPPAENINWLFGWITEWLVYLDNLGNEVLTITTAWTVSGNWSVSGAWAVAGAWAVSGAWTFSQTVVLNGAASDSSPGFDMAGAITTRKLVFRLRTNLTGTPVYARCYYVTNGGGQGSALEFCINASWNPATTQWNLDYSGAYPTLVQLRAGSSWIFALKRYDSAAAFSDNSWTVTVQVTPLNAGLSITGEIQASHFVGNTGRPSSTTGTGIGGLSGSPLPNISFIGTVRDSSGVVEISTGQSAAPAANAHIWGINYAQTWSSAPRVNVTPANQLAAALSANQQVFVSSETTGGFQVSSGSTALPAGAGPYRWRWTVMH